MKFQQNGIEVAASKGKGRGVFATKDISAGSIIEVAPVVIMPEISYEKLEQTLLADYLFENDYDELIMALGYASVYNHSFEPNADWLVSEDKIIISALKTIGSGDEIFIDYGWDPYWYYEKGIITKQQFEQLLLDEED